MARKEEMKLLEFTNSRDLNMCIHLEYMDEEIIITDGYISTFRSLIQAKEYLKHQIDYAFKMEDTDFVCLTDHTKGIKKLELYEDEITEESKQAYFKTIDKFNPTNLEETYDLLLKDVFPLETEVMKEIFTIEINDVFYSKNNKLAVFFDHYWKEYISDKDALARFIDEKTSHREKCYFLQVFMIEYSRARILYIGEIDRIVDFLRESLLHTSLNEDKNFLTDINKRLSLHFDNEEKIIENWE